MDVSSNSRPHDGVKFLLTAVEVFSKLAWVEPLRSKCGEEVRGKLKKVIEDSNYRYLQTGKGTKFCNTLVQQLFRERKVKCFSSENEVIKSSMVKRFNQTLRDKIHGYLTIYRQGRNIDNMSDMVAAYNHTRPSPTGFAPVKMNGSEEVFFMLYKKDRQV